MPFVAAAQVAFPGAEGFGAVTRGGYGDPNNPNPALKIITSTDPVAFATAINSAGARVVVFKTGGVINLTGDIVINKPYLTIAGQTAPGDGIVIKGGAIKIATHDVIIRGLRFRPDTSPPPANVDNRDAAGVEGNSVSYNIIFDRCSFSWSVDETFSIFDNNTLATYHDITIQNCIFAEALKSAGHSKGDHGYSFLIGSRATNISLHHNYFAHNQRRQPRSGQGGSKVEVINNVVYNYEQVATELVQGDEAPGLAALMNIQRNYYKRGPSSNSNNRRGVNFDAGIISGSQFYLQGNIDNWRTSDTQDEWDCVSGTPNPLTRSNTPAFTGSGITMDATAFDARFPVLQRAGAVPRDVVDRRVVQDFYGGDGGMVNAGNWPTYNAGTAPADNDGGTGDGMADAWELANGLNPTQKADRNGDLDGDGYRNWEEYVNSLFDVTAATQSREAELFTTKTTSAGDSQQQLSDTGASGGKWIRLNANGVGDYLELSPMNNIPAGTYTIKVSFKRNASFGQFKLRINGTNADALASEVVDQYATGSPFSEVTVGNFYFDGSPATFRFEVVGKNAASSGYNLCVDKIVLVP